MSEDKASARYVSEFLGTFVLVATVCGNVLSGQALWSGTSIGCSLAVMIYALGKSSGAHFNPAVSVALALARKCHVSEVLKYAVAQLAGGLLAAVLMLEAFGEGDIPIQPSAGYEWWQACLAELLYTFVLCFVVLNVAASTKHAGKNQFYGIAIGFVIVAGAFGAGNISGGCFNPAVAVGLDFASALMHWRLPQRYVYMYIAFELVGAGLAAGLFRVVRPEDYTPGLLEGRSYPMLSKLTSEFLGTYVLVVTVALNVLTGSPAAALSIACSLMCMIFALGTVSGAHFNPAVTVAIVASGRGKCSVKEGAQYMVAQLVAGILAARSAVLLTGKSFEALKPAESAWSQVFAAELVWTVVLAFVVVSVATVKSALTEYFGFAIGMCVTVGGYAIGSISGGSLNPAVSLGISSASKIDYAWQFIPYACFELLASAVAAGLFLAMQPSEFEDLAVADGDTGKGEKGDCVSTRGR
jgi:aquaporin Z